MKGHIAPSVKEINQSQKKHVVEIIISSKKIKGDDSIICSVKELIEDG